MASFDLVDNFNSSATVISEQQWYISIKPKINAEFVVYQIICKSQHTGLSATFYLQGWRLQWEKDPTLKENPVESGESLAPMEFRNLVNQELVTNANTQLRSWVY